MKSRHSQKCLSPFEVSGLNLTINVSQNITSCHTDCSHFGLLWKAFLQISEIEMLVFFFFLTWKIQLFHFCTKDVCRSALLQKIC